MSIKALILAFTIVVTTSSSSPLSSYKNNKNVEGRVLYDQRQEGEWNVRADLKNFVILIIPTQSSTSAPAAANPAVSGLFDFLTKSVPKKSHHLKRFHQNHHQVKKNDNNNREDAAQETRHFIESKSAPYHVDISKSRSHLAKLHPTSEPIVISGEEIVIAKSPSVALIKGESNVIANSDSHDERIQNARAYVLAVPDGEQLVKKTETETEKEMLKNKDVKKTIEKGTTSLSLLGAEYEQCGPGLTRDAQGICRIANDSSQ